MSFPIVAVIMAGGRGTRIASYNSEVPKPMIPVAGKPVLEYEIDCLRNQGCREIILVIGFLGKKIRDYFGDGDRFGVRITYIVEEEPLGTAVQRLKDARSMYFRINRFNPDDHIPHNKP